MKNEWFYFFSIKDATISQYHHPIVLLPFLLYQNNDRKTTKTIKMIKFLCIFALTFAVASAGKMKFVDCGK